MTPEKPEMEIRLARTFRAPPERVFDAWTEPAKLARWFGPDGFTTTTHEFDLRPGGTWRHTMRGPDGKEYPNRIVFVEVERARRLVYDHVSPPPFRTTVTFEPDPAGTRMTFRMAFSDPDAYKVATEVHGAREGLRQTVARLAGFVESGPPGDPEPEVVSARVFAAPRGRLFDAFADPAQLARWWGPEGFASELREFDLRPGGRWRFDMVGPDGARHPQDKTFVEVERPARIVLRHSQRGHDFLMTMTFDEAPGGTLLTWRMRFASPAELAAVERQVVEGNEQNFDRLAAHLARTAAGTHGDPGMQTTPRQDTGFTIERTFKAPPEKVWRMWTTKEGIAKWWVLSARDMGYDMRVREMDVRPGGRFAFEMESKEHKLVNGGTYVTVRPYDLLAWTWHFDIFLAPGQKPYDVPISVSFERLPDGGTRMRFTQGPLSAPEHTEGSRQGVMQNFEKLAQALGE